MNTVLSPRSPFSPPPERSLPNHARHRARLLGVIGKEQRPQRRRRAAPAFAAMSVAALTIGAAVAVQQLAPGAALTPITGPPKADPVGGTPSEDRKARADRRTVPTEPRQRPAEPAPKARDLTRQETASFMQECEAMTATDFLAGFEAVLAIDLPAERRAWVPAAWLVARSGREFALCVRDGRRTMLSAGKFGSMSAKDIPSLFAAVDQRGDGFGLVTRPVTTVTVQPPHGVAQEAVLRDGFWFSPIPDPPTQTSERGSARSEDEANDGVIGINPLGTILRGYDANGTLVYDSSVDGPTVKECYTDPDGTTVVVHNGVPNSSPESCRRTLTWRR